MQKQVVAAVPLLAVLFSTSASAQNAQPRPRIVAVDLGTLYPDGSTEPRAINERGTVVGVARRPDSTETAFMWTRAEGFTALVDHAVATDVNNRGEVVGWVNTCGYLCPSRGFVWSATAGLRDLGEFVPYAVNDKGNMAGACQRRELRPQACVLIENVVEAIGPDPLGGLALDINNRDLVAGVVDRTTDDGGIVPEAFTWSRTRGVRLLPRGDADTTEAAAINEAGSIAGLVVYHGTATRDPDLDAALWRKQSLRTLADPDWTSGNGINNRGWIVGVISRAGIGPNRPLLWIPGTLAAELPAPAGLEGWYAADVTNSGIVVGAANTADGKSHAVLWKVRRTRTSTPND